MKDTEETKQAERASVKMWPGITAGIIIGLIAFILSFDALRLVFVACGINPLLSWGGPVCVDGTILLCTWATWGFKKGHIRGSAYPWIGLVLFSSFSIAGNALHAMLNTGFTLPAWVPPAIMSIPPVALLYSTHLIVIIAGDRLDKINTILEPAIIDKPVKQETKEQAEPTTPTAQPTPAPATPTPAPAPAPAPTATAIIEPEPEIPDLFDFQTIVPDMEDDADPKADEAEAPAAEASTPIPEADEITIPQPPVMRETVIIPTLMVEPETSEPSMDNPDMEQAETTVEDNTQSETQPEQDTTPVSEQETGNDVQESAEPSEETKPDETTEAESETEQPTPEPETVEPKKPRKKPRKGRGRTAAAEDDAWLAWFDELKAQGEKPNPDIAVEAGLAASGSTAKRYLARFRKTYPERF